MKKKYSILVCLIILTLSCNQQNEEVKSLINEFHRNKIVFNESTKYVVILPEVGCGGCISEGVGFIKKNLKKIDCDNKEVEIIFTSIMSKKLMLRELDILSLEEHCFEIDEINKYRIDNSKSIYPLILYLKKGKIVRMEFQSPDNPNAFNKLESKYKDLMI